MSTLERYHQEKSLDSIKTLIEEGVSLDLVAKAFKLSKKKLEQLLESLQMTKNGAN